MRTIIVRVKHDATAAETASKPGSRCAGQNTQRHDLGVRREVIILHAGREYRLRVTQNGRLILTA